ncbi:MAG: ABC transporter permease subunit [Synergistaceae bacterium]|nr:ABC transporter permease subunit [Synergistaceae bacterium]
MKLEKLIISGLMDPSLVYPICLTIKTCIVSIMMFLLAGVPLALWISRSDGVIPKLVSFFVTLPLVFPPVALGYILLMTLGRAGIGGALEEYTGFRIVFSQTGVFLAAFIAGLPMLVRPLQAALGGENIIKLEEAARVTGCGPFRTFIFITVPLVRSTIASGLLLGSARATGEVGITMMLGGNISGRTNTISLEIFNRVSRGEFDEAGDLCLLLAIAGLLLFIALEKIHKKKES